MGTFDGLTSSLSALYAHRRAMDVAGQNIANVATEGYSRQRVNLQAVAPPTVAGVFVTPGRTSGGVAVAGIDRMRDAFLEDRGRAEHALLENAIALKATYSQLEDVVGEPGDTGLQHALGEMWAGFGDVANHPGDLAARNQVLQRATAVTDWLRSASGALATNWSAQHVDLTNLATEVNDAAAGIAELNQAIQRATLSGQPANELADQRDAYAMQIARLTGAVTRAGENGALDVYLGGTALVRGALAQRVTVSGPMTLADVSPTTQVGLVWAGYGNQQVTGVGGKAGGVLHSLNEVVPGFRAALDNVAAGLAAAVNGQHASGYDLDGAAGGSFFTGTTAATLAVAVTDPRKVAAAGEPGTLDGSNADALAAIATRASGPDASYRSIVTNLGADTAAKASRVSAQSAVTATIDDARTSSSGVNLDEEMVTMLTYQRAYEGASRMLTAVDEMLDQLINRTGLVGR